MTVLNFWATRSLITTLCGAGIEYFLPAYDERYRAEIDFNISQDLSAHHGQYLEATAKLKLADWQIPWGGPRIEPNLVLTTGLGSSAHNQYFYGEGAQGWSLNNFYYGVWFALPEEADRYFPIVQVMGFTTLGEGNRQAFLARGRNRGILLSFLLTGNLLD